MTISLTRRWGIALREAAFAWTAPRGESGNKVEHVKLERLSRHVLRDLGLSDHEMRDFAAQERVRFLN